MLNFFKFQQLLWKLNFVCWNYNLKLSSVEQLLEITNVIACFVHIIIHISLALFCALYNIRLKFWNKLDMCLQDSLVSLGVLSNLKSATVLRKILDSAFLFGRTCWKANAACRTLLV